MNVCVTVTSMIRESCMRIEHGGDLTTKLVTLLFLPDYAGRRGDFERTYVHFCGTHYSPTELTEFDICGVFGCHRVIDYIIFDYGDNRKDRNDFFLS